MSARPLILLVDTSLAGARLALVERANPRSIWTGSANEVQGSAARLPGLLAEGLLSTGAGTKDICGAVVSTGPGSFTGIRVGIAFARGLGAGLGRPVAGCSSLGLLAARRAAMSGTSVAVLAGSTATNGYLAFAVDGKSPLLRAISVDSLSWPDETPTMRVMLAAGWSLMEKKLAGTSLDLEVVPVAKIADEALVCMANAAPLLLTGDWTSGGGYSESELDPVYLRRSSVEERLDGRPDQPGHNHGGGFS